MRFRKKQNSFFCRYLNYLTQDLFVEYRAKHLCRLHSDKTFDLGSVECRKCSSFFVCFLSVNDR